MMSPMWAGRADVRFGLCDSRYTAYFVEKLLKNCEEIAPIDSHH